MKLDAATKKRILNRIDTMKLLLSNGGWIKHEIATNAEGKPVSAIAFNQKPVHFCLLGALGRAAYRTKLDYYTIRDALYDVADASIVEFNDDEKTQLSDVLSLLNEVRERLEEKL